MVYHIEAPFAPWLWPTLELLGILLQAIGAIGGQKWIFPAAFGLLAIGCWHERDITLATGDALACIGLFLYRE